MDISDWTGIANVVTAVCSVGIASYAVKISKNQSIANREHNELSIRPLLTYSTDYNFKTGHFKLFIKNSGLGPAIITDFVAYRDKHIVIINDPAMRYGAAHVGLELGTDYLAIEQVKAGHVIAANDTVTMLELTSDKKGDPNIFSEVLDELNRVGFRIEYQDAYNNQMKPLRPR
ncbi:hypothetical protein [Marinomonas ostreistagni]|uniref:hypothetical protein n=1 Tax=Marinomonas ostreistagni TaxID=359209 RepID=UPI00194EF2E8|nr:hypothetical protein [Marinomonas ostreistagni]MBM6550305.1 hypothetical protein [Marinomonas ostreistagni]